MIDDCWAAMVLSMFSRPVSVRPRSGCAAVHVQSAGKRWLDAFPQHGPGRKHERPIVLTQWQWEIVGRHRGDFVRGLIHSDGCRTINRFTTRLPSGRLAEYAYPRYFFSNLSPDIRDLFSEACDALGVRWSRSSSRNISVSHRRSVALLDEIGCAKGLIRPASRGLGEVGAPEETPPRRLTRRAVSCGSGAGEVLWLHRSLPSF